MVAVDEIDLAQENDELFRHQAIRAHFRRNGKSHKEAEAQAGMGRRPDLSGGPMCIDCEEEIGSARLAANPEAIRCIDCQTKLERRAKRG